MSLQYGELWPTNGWDRLADLLAPHHISTGIASWLRYCMALLVLGISHPLRRWTEGTTYIRQGGHHVGHWATFLVFFVLSGLVLPSYARFIPHLPKVNTVEQVLKRLAVLCCPTACNHWRANAETTNARKLLGWNEIIICAYHKKYMTRTTN